MKDVCRLNPSTCLYNWHSSWVQLSLISILISIHTFRLSLTPFFAGEKYLGRKINLHVLRIPAKTCHKRKLVWSSIILVLRIYWGLSSLRPDKAVGRPFCKNFLILVKCPHESRQKSDWFRCKKISKKFHIWTSNANREKDIFSSYTIRFTTMRMSHAKSVSGNQALDYT